MVDAVIFDMDGLLINSESFWRRSQVDAFKSVGINLNDDDMRLTMGRRIDEVVAYWYHERPWSGKAQKDTEALIIDQVVELVKSEGRPMLGVKSTLDFFRSRGLPMALASSSSGKIIDVVLDVLQIKGYFEHVYSAENETYGKPHPGVYITTASLLGIPSHRCLAFEDSPSGVLSAKAAKMKCIAVPDEEHALDKIIQIADVVLGSLDEFDESIFNSL